MIPGARLRRLAATVLAAAAALLVACEPPGARPPRLYAASSLVPALDAFPGARTPPLVPVHGATSLLAQQLRAGAEPGVLLAADTQWADALEADGLVELGTRVDLLGNSLVVIAPADSTVTVSSLADLLAPSVSRIAVAETTSVPLGRYSRAALASAGVWEPLQRRLVATADARAVVALVARGEVDLGIAYASDASASGVRRVLDVPAHLHPRIVYPLLLARGASPQARELWRWLQGDDAAAAFAQAGFLPLADPR